MGSKAKPTRESKPGAGARPVKRVVRLCDVPCPMCGSTDIVRHYRRTDETWRTHNNMDYPERNTSLIRVGWYNATAKRNIITNHCRCCQHEWATEISA